MSNEFFNAIKQGKLDEIQRLLSVDPNLIRTRENGLSPILVAAYHQEPEIAAFLAKKTATLSIFEAAATGQIEQIIRHLAHKPELVNEYSEDGFQPLGLACFFDQLEAVEYLIKAGALVNSPSQNPLQVTPLQSASAARKSKIVMILLSNGADPNCREQGGYTPLHTAAQNGDLDIIRALLFNGADMNVTSNDGKTALDLATEAGQAEAADLLKEGITRRFRGMRKKSK